MVVDLTKNKKPTKDIIEEVVMTNLLIKALVNVPNDDGKHVIPRTWLQLLNEEVAKPLRGLNRNKVRGIANRTSKLTKDAMSVSHVNTNKELAIAVSIAILEFVKNKAILDTTTQTVHVAAKIIEEALDYGDWGNVKRAKVGAAKMINFFHSKQFFSYNKIWH